MTRLAVLSDIHGNSLALQQVLDDLDAQGGADSIIVLGDLVVCGPDPLGVLSLLRERESVIYVRGNTDRYLLERLYPDDPGGQDWESQVLASFPWAAHQLGKEGLEFIASLPPQQLVRFSNTHIVQAVHGSPRDDEENISPNLSDADLAAMLDDLPYNLLVCGHTHLPFERVVAGRHIVNVGSVGLPFDGDPRSCYAMIDLRPNGSYQVEFRRVAYDIKAVVHELIHTTHPAADVSTFNLINARPLGEKLIYTDQMRNGNNSQHGAGGIKTAESSYLDSQCCSC
jgi:putative phosphoesterase